MAYNSITYLAFFLVAVYLVWCLAPARLRPFVLLAGSAVYYVSFSVKYAVYILLAIFVSWGAGRLLARDAAAIRVLKKDKAAPDYKAKLARLQARRHLVVTAAVLILLGLLVWRKYAGFLVQVLDSLLALLPGGLAVAVPKLAQPIGISFYSLMAISYVVDIFRGAGKAHPLWEVALFVSFWPHIMEGPFDRCTALEATLFSRTQRPTYQNLCFGAQRMLWGMFKKVVVADRAAQYIGTVYDNSASYGGRAVMLATLLYTIQLYTEFSGAIDIAAGTAELFGIPLAENFRQPFFARSVGEFWRRWHISLGAWLREYVFQPFIMTKANLNFGKKCRKWFGAQMGRTLPVWLGLIVVWFCTGLWHGAAWLFIVYGMYYCVLQLFGEATDALLTRFCPRFSAWRAKSRLYHAFQLLRTFALVNIGMLIFRADDLPTAWHLIRSMFAPSPTAFAVPIKEFYVLALGVLLVLAVDILHEKGVHIRASLAALPLPLRWSAYAALGLSIAVFGAYGANYAPTAFIYAQF
ncbi:MAG: hypothetical protein LKJ90_08820 [Faecalibacterium sp.]|nr:hypothetical protein [Faecalibacterium sp.]